MKRREVSLALSDAAIGAALRAGDGGARLVVTVKPNAKHDALEVAPDGGVLVRVRAPAVEGKANARVVEVIAAVLGVAKRAVVLVRGEGARHKELALALCVEEARRRLLADP